MNRPAKIKNRSIQGLGKFIELIRYPGANVQCIRGHLNVWQNEDIGNGIGHPQEEGDRHQHKKGSANECI
jgi:hypothetical protein